MTIAELRAEPAEMHPRLEYTAEVVERVSKGDPERTRWGATIYNELVTFEGSNGQEVIRELTIAEPNPDRGPVSPYPIVETDPWTTGESGFNRDRIRTYTKLGYSVLWLHHGGKYSRIQADKSVDRGAHQMHATLDDLQTHSYFRTDKVILGGYSRGAMSADKFIANEAAYGRHTVYSDTEAPCFVRDMSAQEKISTLAAQVPSELRELGKVAVGLVGRALDERNPKLLLQYLGTFDLHPRNVIQEALWAHALVNANVGYSTHAMPKDTVGVRTFFGRDYMSQESDFRQLYDDFDNLHVFTERGAHIAGAAPEYQNRKNARFVTLMNHMQQNNMSLAGLKIQDIVPEAAPHLSIVA